MSARVSPFALKCSFVDEMSGCRTIKFTKQREKKINK